jgi:hypothetical protein
LMRMLQCTMQAAQVINTSNFIWNVIPYMEITLPL